MNVKEVLRKKRIGLPAAFVDLDAFESNAATMAALVQAAPSLKIRLATKSIRSPDLTRKALASSKTYKGLMCFSSEEIRDLAKDGFDDFLLAYPTMQGSDINALAEVVQEGKKLAVVVDDLRQLCLFDRAPFKGQKNFTWLCEVDLSLQIGALVVGVRRSPLQSANSAFSFCQSARTQFPDLKFGGVMAYEAQVAGLPDRNPFKKILTPVLSFVRSFSAKRAAKIRKDLRAKLEADGFTIETFNGGGTGSLSFNVNESDVLTEVTAGSGLYCPHLFDYYSNFSMKPACFFALPTVRQPSANWLTCLGGGFIASGEPGWDRVPRPVNRNIALSNFEACGEVQTPVRVGSAVQLGEAILFRHAKAGELLERFNDVHLVRGNEIQETVKSYRGLGRCYF